MTATANAPRLLVLLLAGCGLTPAFAHAQAPRPPETATATRIEPVALPVGGVVLVGALHLPEGDGPHPAALLLPGARDSRFLPGVAADLATRGVAVLDLDKRGVGASGGRWDRQSFAGRADDAHHALDFLRAHPSIDGARIGVIGHSQGGWIAQVVAAERPELSFAVLVAGPAQTVRDQILTYEQLLHERRGRSPEEVNSAVRSLRRQLGAARATGPVCRALRLHYICRIVDFDPAPWLERLHVPVLALFGEVDPMVPPDPNVALLCRALLKAGNSDVTVHVFPHANHDFLPARTGLPEEYPSIERRYVPGFLEWVGHWVTLRTGVRSGEDDPAAAASTRDCVGHMHS
jgi:uncharacterized protein